MNCVIIGGTGTLGQEITRQLLMADQAADIIIFSRDELKQQEMKKKFPGGRISFVLGDVRDKDSLRRAFKDQCTHSVFHVAALKHVDVLEANPEEAVKTNILGAMNVADICLERGVGYCAFSSTDKAVEAINAYGASKLIAEKIFLNHNRHRASTCRFSVFRWGNIIGSRGSVVHYFAKNMIEGKPINLTDPEMTRFWLTIEEAAGFMLDRYRGASFDVPEIPRCKSATLTDLVESIARVLLYFGKTAKIDMKFAGKRPGEKIHESLIACGPHALRSDTSEKYTKQELDLLLKPFVEQFIVMEAAA